MIFIFGVGKTQVGFQVDSSKSRNMTERELAMKLHCSSVEHETVIEKAINLKDEKLKSLALEAKVLCSKVTQHFRIDKMSLYLDRLLEVGEVVDAMAKESHKPHCTRLATVEEYSKLLLAIDDLFIESGKREVSIFIRFQKYVSI